MARTFNIGSGKAQNPADDFVRVTVHPGETVKVTNAAGSSVNYHAHGRNGGKDGTVASGSTQTFTTPGTHFITSDGVSSVTVTGGQYGG